MNDTATVIGDLLRAACDDERVKLPVRAERRVIERMAELLEVAGLSIVASPTRAAQTGSQCSPTSASKSASPDCDRHG